MAPVTFWVPGQPRPKGSMAVLPRKHVRPLVHRGECYYRIRDLYVGPRPAARADGSRVDLLGQWVTAVKGEALHCKPRGQGLQGEFHAEMLFFLNRPAKSIHGNIPLGPPDVDKLERAVDDALTGMFWADDAQVTRLVAEKRWSDDRGPGALITVDHRTDQLPLI